MKVKNKKKKKTSSRVFFDSSLSHAQAGTAPKLEIVLKCESTGSLEAVRAGILAAAPAGINIKVFHEGIGPVNKTDIFMAESASRLIIGYGVGVTQNIEPLLSQYGVEVRLYDVIYHLTDDVKKIAASLIGEDDIEGEIIGRARVIALFKSSRKGIILGCEVEKGHLAHGDYFQVITAMGPVYSGKIESLHIENDSVRLAKKGQQVGLKISNFKKASVGAFVESYRPTSKKNQSWSPQGILRTF